MSRETTVNNMSFADAAKRNWYLSVKSPSPKQTLSVRFEDGKEYKYLGTGKVDVGDPVVIDYGGATSYKMGNVVKTEDGITIKRTHALKPLFTFSTDPDKTAIRKNAEYIVGMESVDDIKAYFVEEYYSYSTSNVGKFRPVDHLLSGVLNAISVVAFPELARDDALNLAKQFLSKEKAIPAFMFGPKYAKMFFGYSIVPFDEKIQDEVILTGFYPGWDSYLKSFDFQALADMAPNFETTWGEDKLTFCLYFDKGNSSLEKYMAKRKDFAEMTNELVFRSALSILIRGGFTNLLRAALSVEMPIKGFYQKLIEFAEEIGSTECSKLLKQTDYEHKVFEKVTVEKKVKAKDK